MAVAVQHLAVDLCDRSHALLGVLQNVDLQEVENLRHDFESFGEEQLYFFPEIEFLALDLAPQALKKIEKQAQLVILRVCQDRLEQMVGSGILRVALVGQNLGFQERLPMLLLEIIPKVIFVISKYVIKQCNIESHNPTWTINNFHVVENPINDCQQQVRNFTIV